MSRTNRGLDLTNVSGVSQDEVEAFHAFYGQTLGHAHSGLDFWLEHGVETLKRYRAFSDVATPNNYESSRKVFVFGFLPWYAIIGYDVGVRYLLHIRQRMGLTKEQILEGIAMAFLVIGPAGMETISRSLKDFEWITPETPASFPDGWAPDPDAFRSGLDFSQEEITPAEMRLLEDWYLRTLGEVPPYVRFLNRQRPALLKAHRSRYENCLKLLPKQMMPTTMLHYDVIRGFQDGIRENVLLARAFGVTREITLNTIGSALIMGGMSATSIIERAAGDVFDSWEQAG